MVTKPAKKTKPSKASAAAKATARTARTASTAPTQRKQRGTLTKAGSKRVTKTPGNVEPTKASSSAAEALLLSPAPAPPRESSTPSDPWLARAPAIASVEVATVARGVVVLDQILKRAEVTVVAARTLSPGRYLIVLTAPEAEIEEALEAALSTAKEDLVDHLVLFDPADDLRSALASTLDVELDESLALVETTTVSSALLAAERALKNSDVRLLDLRLGAGLSGKGVFSLTGPLHMIEAARSAIEAFVPNERIVRVELVAHPHPDLPRHLLMAEPTIVRGPKRA
ncbi:MAG: BMC domain-containing protein [Deltaproteobacteria bacterium]|nr:BMC domain-containing protein [Deltaproteobacteria bacterium]